jgi:predicted Zn-dependent peptidase
MLAGLSFAQDLAAFEKRVTVKKLSNGLTAIVCIRPHTAPVFSFYTNVDAGSVQDPMGKTGLAHMFEHMAFKGTDTIGTKDYAAERTALQKVEDAYAAYLSERDKRVGRDEQKVKQLEQQWQDAIKDAQQYVVPNEFSEIIERNGGENVNASTEPTTPNTTTPSR